MARFIPAFQIFRIVRPTEVPCDLYSAEAGGGWSLTAEVSGAGFSNIPGGGDFTGTEEDEY